MDRKLVVLFPGWNYGADKPLLYYIDWIYEAKGYEEVKIQYETASEEAITLTQRIEKGKLSALKQLEAMDLSVYSDVVFVSKSMGTVAAGYVEEQLKLKVRHIYLTPLPDTLQYIENPQKIIYVAAGTDDRFLAADVLKQHCKERGIKLLQFEGVGHRFEAAGDIKKTLAIVEELVKNVP